MLFMLLAYRLDPCAAFVLSRSDGSFASHPVRHSHTAVRCFKSHRVPAAQQSLTERVARSHFIYSHTFHIELLASASRFYLFLFIFYTIYFFVLRFYLTLPFKIFLYLTWCALWTCFLADTTEVGVHRLDELFHSSTSCHCIVLFSWPGGRHSHIPIFVGVPPFAGIPSSLSIHLEIREQLALTSKISCSCAIIWYLSLLSRELIYLSIHPLFRPPRYYKANNFFLSSPSLRRRTINIPYSLKIICTATISNDLNARKDICPRIHHDRMKNVMDATDAMDEMCVTTPHRITNPTAQQRNLVASLELDVVDALEAPGMERGGSRDPLPPSPVAPSITSRAYLMEVALCRTDQQKCAFMTKVADSYRHALVFKKRLLAVFRDDINPILEYEGTVASTPREARYFLELEATLTQVGNRELRHFYPQCVSEAAAPEVALRLLRREWEVLIARLSDFLRVIPSQPVCAVTSAAPFADLDPLATEPAALAPPIPSPADDEVLRCSSLQSEMQQRQQLWIASVMVQSMELFERFYPLQAAVLEAERWVQWYHTDFPTWDAARRSRDAKLEQQQLATLHKGMPRADAAEAALRSRQGSSRGPSQSLCQGEEDNEGLCGSSATETQGQTSEGGASTPHEEATTGNPTGATTPVHSARHESQSNGRLSPLSGLSSDEDEATATSPPLLVSMEAENADEGREAQPCERLPGDAIFYGSGRPAPAPMAPPSPPLTVEMVVQQLHHVPFPRLALRWEAGAFAAERQAVETLRFQRKLVLMYSANEQLKRNKLERQAAILAGVTPPP
eukprot:gene3622-2559_t